MGSLLNPSFALVPAKILAAENSTVAILLPFYQPVLSRITLRQMVADLSSACPLFNPEFEGLYYGFNEVGSKNEPALQLGHKRLNTTLTYARVHDQTVAEDYFAAMGSVEKRLDLLGKEEEKPQEVSESERDELLALADQLLGPKLSLKLCVEVASQMLTILQRSDSALVVIQNIRPMQDHSPTL